MTPLAIPRVREDKQKPLLTQDIVEERARLEVLVRGCGRRKTEQRFGGHHHEGLAEVPCQLATQHMIVLGGRGGVHDVHVDGIAIGGCFLGVAELQEALDATGTVLRCSAVVSMGQ